MAIQYAGGTYVDNSSLLTASNIADIVSLVQSRLATAGWTVTNLGAYNFYGVVPTLFNQANPANNDTVTIAARVYTWKTVLTGAADEILIGANQTASMFNFKACINAEAGAGTLYGTGTAINASVTAQALMTLNGSANNPSVMVYSKSGAAVAVTKTGNFAWYNTTTLAQTLYRMVSAETPAFQKATQFIGVDVNATANRIFFAGLSRGLITGVGKVADLSLAAGDTARILANRYGFHLFKSGTFGTNGTGFYGQVPHIPTFLAPKKVTGATNASPIVITTSANHGYTTGDSVLVKYVEGNTAANGTFSITVITPTTFSLNASVGNGAFSGSLGLVANQTPPRIETLEQHYVNLQNNTGPCYLNASNQYGESSQSLGAILDGTVYQGVATASFLFPEPVNLSAQRFTWVSGEGVALEPLVIYTNAYGSLRAGGQLYNAWWSASNTVGASANTADGHTWYGIYNNDTEGQLFLLTS